MSSLAVATSDGSESVEALLVPGVDVQNFDTKTAKDKVTAVSENGVEITH